MKIKKYKNGDIRQRFQGDMSIIKIDKLDSDIVFSPLEDKAIVGHSESGHHHVIVKDREEVSDIEIAKDQHGYFIRVNKGRASLVHEKTGGHEAQVLDQGIYFIGKQYEYSEVEDKKTMD